MRARSSAARTAFSEREKLLIRDLAARIPLHADEEHPAVRDLVRYLESLALPWYAPLNAAAVHYAAMMKTERIEELVDRACRCTEFGEYGPEGWVRLPRFEP